MRWRVSRQTAQGWRPLGAWPLSAVVGIPLVSQARSRGCSGRWLRRAKTLARVAGARCFITVRGAALLAGENPRHASCGSIRRRRTRPAEAASQLRTKQSDSLASSASTWSSPAILDDDTRTHAHTRTHTHAHTHTHTHAHTHTHTDTHTHIRMYMHTPRCQSNDKLSQQLSALL